MGHLNSFLRDYETLALSLSSSISWWVILSIEKLGLFAFSSVWVILLWQWHQLSYVGAIVLQQFGFVWNVLESDWTRRYVNGLSSCAIYYLSRPARLAAIILTRMVWLLNSSVGSCVLFGDLIQNSRNWALSGVVLLFGSTLVNFSDWRRALALRVTHYMRGYVRVLLCRKLLKYLLRLFLTCTLLSCKDSLSLFCLKLSGLLLLLLHQKLLIL